MILEHGGVQGQLSPPLPLVREGKGEDAEEIRMFRDSSG